METIVTNEAGEPMGTEIHYEDDGSSDDYNNCPFLVIRCPSCKAKDPKVKPMNAEDVYDNDHCCFKCGAKLDMNTAF